MPLIFLNLITVLQFDTPHLAMNSLNMVWPVVTVNKLNVTCYFIHRDSGRYTMQILLSYSREYG